MVLRYPSQPASRSSRSPRSSHRWLARMRAGAMALAVAAQACTGTIGDPEGSSPTGSAEQLMAERSRFPRLSHAQWENTMRDLLRLDATPGLSASFTGDPLGGVFDNNEAVMQVTPGLWGDYQIAAEELSAFVTADGDRLARIVPQDDTTDAAARARGFIRHFGRRAYRRPLTEAEIDGYVALFDNAKEILPDADPLVGGVQLVLQAFLQSPFLVYRVEASESPRKDGLIPLSGYENATNLAYFLWNTMPDDELLDAAEAGELSTPAGVRAHAERMLVDPRAREVVGSFHAQLYDYERYLDLNKDPELYPQFTPETGEDMQREAELFVDHIVFERGGNLTDLLTARTSFVNDRLAASYGLSGEFTADFKEVELDATQRSGLLTRLGFLAANGTARQPDTIHRGVFVNLRILCADLPPPPNDVKALPASNEGTNRDRVNAHTGPNTCGGSCHATMINPIGFSFENYDAIGQWRTTDNELPINAADKYSFKSGVKEFANAVELSQVIADSEEAHRCYAKHWAEFTLGRDVTQKDEPLLLGLTEDSRSGVPVKELILKLVESDAFLTRAPVEAP